MKKILEIQGVSKLSEVEKRKICGGTEPDMSNCRRTGSIGMSGIVTVSYRCGEDRFGRGSNWYLTYYNGVYHSHTAEFEA